MKRLSTFLMALLLMSIGAKAADEMDLTSSLVNPSFETNDTTKLTADKTRGYNRNDAGTYTGAYTISADALAEAGWTLTNTPSVCDIMTADAAATDNDFGAPGAPSDGTYMLYMRDSWDEGDLATTLTQKVTLSAGTYKLTVDSKCIHNGATNVSPAKLVANGEHAELPYHSLFVPDNWDETSVTFRVTDETADVEIGVEVTFSNGQAGFSVLLDNFTLTAVDDMELIAHYEEAEFSHWSISGNTNGSLQLNTWSVELDTESGMAVPFMQYWVGAGTNLSAATISHKTLVGLPEGDYIVSVFARAFNEAESDATSTAADVGKGITFTANSQNVDLTTGTKGTFGYSTEVYGVYELKCTVTDDGTLDIGFTVASETACDWIAWKDLKVVMDTDEYPELTALDGDMTQRAKTNMETAIATYATNPSGDNFLAAIDALQKAQESREAYANGATIEEDDYLIINVESGYYLAGGLSWGTCAMEGGRPQFVTLETYGTEGAYSLNSNQYNNADNHYLNVVSTDGLYMDGTITGWTIEYDATNGGYTFYNATVGGYLTGAGFQKQVTAGTATSKSYWKLVTKDEIIARMDTASVDSPVDVSALIPSCEPKRNPWGGYNVNSKEVNTGAWTVTGYNVEDVPGNYSLGQNGNAVSCAESWHSDNGFDMHQIVTFPKAGYYILTSQAFHDHTQSGSNIYPSMYAGDRSVEIYRGSVSDNITGNTDMANAYQDLLDGLHPLSLCLYVERDNTDLTVGFTSNYEGGDVWNVFGELGLQYLGNDSYEGFVVHEEEAEVNDWSISNTGTFHLNNWSTEGESDSSGMLTPFMEYWVAGNTSSTLAAATISHTPLTGLYPGMYEVSLDIRILNETGNSVTEGTLFKANNASEDLDTGTDAEEGTSSSNKEVYGTYDLTCLVGADGTLNISIEIPDNVTYNWISFKNLKVTYLGDLSVDWNMTAAEWGTLILPFAADVPDELVAYTIASVDKDDDEEDGIVATLSLTESGSIDANTPYIMGVAEEAEDYVKTYTFTGTPTNEKDSYTDTAVSGASLTGTFVDMDYSDLIALDGTVYLLQNHEDGDGVAFYPVVTDLSAAATLTPYHCYLTYDASGAMPTKLVLGFAGTDGEATAIVAVESEEAEGNGAIYDLSGRRVSKAVKGVYIQNGKKVLVK